MKRGLLEKSSVNGGSNGKIIAGWWFGTFWFFHILGIIIPTD